MLVPEYIECSFREQIMLKPYRKITVSGICNAANVPRTHFYTYYDNKDDLLDKIVFKDIVQPVVNLQAALRGLRMKSMALVISEHMFLSVYEKKEFYSRVNAINDSANLIRSLTNRCTVLNANILQTVDIPEIEKSYLAYITATVQAAMISKWIERGYDTDSQQMAQFFRRWISDSWKFYFLQDNMPE